MNDTSAGRLRSGRDDREADTPSATDEVLLIYDWECPACDTYCRRVRIAPGDGRQERWTTLLWQRRYPRPCGFKQSIGPVQQTDASRFSI